jgi:hypothetical protein
MITREDLDRVFDEQRIMTDAAVDTIGLESYIDNLGFEAQDLWKWTNEYVADNLPGADQEDQTYIAAMLTRGITMGLMLGRERKGSSENPDTL